MIKVMIVDDDKLARKGLISIVPWQELGMEVTGEASNGAKAIEIMEHDPVDLAVVDLSMPVMSGFEFLEVAKDRWPALKCVVLSFHENFQSVQSAMRLGAIDYISKMRLEQQDCIDVFRRISDVIITSKADSSSELEEIRTEDNLIWEELQARWLSFYWLYDEGEFVMISKETLDNKVSARRMEHLTVRVIDNARQNLQIDEYIHVPTIKSTASGLEFITELREKFILHAKQSAEVDTLHANMLRASEYVRENIGSPLSMSVVAYEVNMSRSYFAHNFKKTTGQTFNNFLRSERIKKAKELIDDGNLSISDISQAVGYEDDKYFAQVFAKQMGLSPSEYRAKRRIRDTKLS